MKWPLRAALFVVLLAMLAPANAQRGVLASPLPDDLDSKQILDVARQVLTRHGWTLVPQDAAAIEAEKDRSGLRIFLGDRALRFSDLSQRPRGVRQREQRDEGPQLSAVPQNEIDALRGDLAAAFAGNLPLAGGKPLKPTSQLLFNGFRRDAEAEKVMAAARSAFVGRRWEVRNDADGALIAHIHSVDVDSTLKVFLVDGALRFTDRSTDRKGGKASVPERWVNYVRADLRQAASRLAPQGTKAPARGSASKQGDPAERLKKLKSLLDGGLITQAEYDAKRAEILKDL